MNRRTVLRTAGVTATIGLSGCIEALQEHYEGSFRGLVPIEIHSEADQPYDVTLEAFDPETDRQTYDESYTVTAGERALPPHLDATEQLLRVTRINREHRDRQLTREATITRETSTVIVRLTNDDLRLELERGDEDTEPTTVSGTDGPESNTSSQTDAEPSTNESAANTSE
ncbi:hypothetical protein ACFR99_11460 [Haloarchaeobius amylolyticus]|uniref:Ser-Asp rich fibrinogen-binding, bone sialoprotein-binding protein n=1 Tax=Haloarchaeobius amylolyticus TaxID=1198296 RepID=A0ABD6BGR2_9EURY